MLWWYREGLVGTFAFHFRTLLLLLYPFISVLSNKGKKVIDVVIPGLEEFLHLFKFLYWFSDFPDVHIGKQPNNIIFLIFVVSVNRYDKDIGKEEEEDIKQEYDDDTFEVGFLDLLDGVKLLLLEFVEDHDHLSVVVPQILNVFLTFIHQHIQVSIHKLRQCHLWW